jgi:hypothetical protein
MRFVCAKKETMLFRKRHAVAVLFSIYFLFYVLSPFCFTKDGLNDGNGSSYQLNLSLKNIRVVWGLFLPGRDKQKDTAGGGNNVQLLIRKARALVGTNSVVKFTPPEYAEFVFNEIDFSPRSRASLALYARPEYRTASYLSVSGLSPPSLS